MRFLTDENLSAQLASELRILGHDVFAVIDSDLRGSPDEVLWRLAANQGRIFVTQDLDFPLAERPRPPGLVLIRFWDAFDFDVFIMHLVDFFKAQTEDDLRDRITVLTPDRIRSRPFDA